MHKSLGNVISPLTLIDKHGADVIRWWALATDWRGDVRVGDEILLRVSEPPENGFLRFHARQSLVAHIDRIGDYGPGKTARWRAAGDEA